MENVNTSKQRPLARKLDEDCKPLTLLVRKYYHNKSDYYQRNKEYLKAKARERYANDKNKKLSNESKFNLAEWLLRILLSRGTRVQISSWSLRLRFNLSSGTNRGKYHGYSCGGTSSSGGSAWRRLP
jgi:hypothetical protein